MEFNGVHFIILEHVTNTHMNTYTHTHVHISLLELQARALTSFNVTFSVRHQVDECHTHTKIRGWSAEGLQHLLGATKRALTKRAFPASEFRSFCLGICHFHDMLWNSDYH